jgi:hypothetical protein
MQNQRYTTSGLTLALKSEEIDPNSKIKVLIGISIPTPPKKIEAQENSGEQLEYDQQLERALNKAMAAVEYVLQISREAKKIYFLLGAGNLAPNIMAENPQLTYLEAQQKAVELQAKVVEMLKKKITEKALLQYGRTPDATTGSSGIILSWPVTYQQGLNGEVKADSLSNSDLKPAFEVGGWHLVPKSKKNSASLEESEWRNIPYPSYEKINFAGMQQSFEKITQGDLIYKMAVWNDVFDYAQRHFKDDTSRIHAFKTELEQAGYPIDNDNVINQSKLPENLKRVLGMSLEYITRENFVLPLMAFLYSCEDFIYGNTHDIYKKDAQEGLRTGFYKSTELAVKKIHELCQGNFPGFETLPAKVSTRLKKIRNPLKVIELVQTKQQQEITEDVDTSPPFASTPMSHSPVPFTQLHVPSPHAAAGHPNSPAMSLPSFFSQQLHEEGTRRLSVSASVDGSDYQRSTTPVSSHSEERDKQDTTAKSFIRSVLGTCRQFLTESSDGNLAEKISLITHFLEASCKIESTTENHQSLSSLKFVSTLINKSDKSSETILSLLIDCAESNGISLTSKPEAEASNNQWQVGETRSLPGSPSASSTRRTQRAQSSSSMMSQVLQSQRSFHSNVNLPPPPPPTRSSTPPPSHLSPSLTHSMNNEKSREAALKKQGSQSAPTSPQLRQPGKKRTVLIWPGSFLPSFTERGSGALIPSPSSAPHVSSSQPPPSPSQVLPRPS